MNSLEYMRNLADTVRDTFCNNFDGARTAFCAHVGTVHEYIFLDSFVVDGIANQCQSLYLLCLLI